VMGKRPSVDGRRKTVNYLSTLERRHNEIHRLPPRDHPHLARRSRMSLTKLGMKLPYTQ